MQVFSWGGLRRVHGMQESAGLVIVLIVHRMLGFDLPVLFVNHSRKKFQFAVGQIVGMTKEFAYCDIGTEKTIQQVDRALARTIVIVPPTMVKRVFLLLCRVHLVLLFAFGSQHRSHEYGIRMSIAVDVPFREIQPAPSFSTLPWNYETGLACNLLITMFQAETPETLSSVLVTLSAFRWEFAAAACVT
jgi:hypothetical protein